NISQLIDRIQSRPWRLVAVLKVLKCALLVSLQHGFLEAFSLSGTPERINLKVSIPEREKSGVF
ncbi:hypothetical protein CHS0354_035173, partial [Potamilus streckersoni]